MESIQNPSYTVWVFDHDTAQHHDNDLATDTVGNIDEALAIARFRVQETNHNTGWAHIVDNNIAGKMGDRGVLLDVIKLADDRTRVVHKRDEISVKDIQAKPNQLYIGKVLNNLDSEFIMQDVGRGSLILHQKSKLDTLPSVGDSVPVAIKYDKNGKGTITAPNEKSQSKSQGRD